MPSISLGKNCTISVGGDSLTSVRNVTVNATRSEIECPLFSGGQTLVFPGNTTWSIEVEFIGGEDAGVMTAALQNAEEPVQVSGTHISVQAYVFSLSASEPLDDVVTYTATLKRSL